MTNTVNNIYKAQNMHKIIFLLHVFDFFSKYLSILKINVCLLEKTYFGKKIYKNEWVYA